MHIPKTQTAIQLTGPKTLERNSSKEVIQPGPRQFLVEVEAVGLCFSDMKLLSQFSGHVRKSEVLEGVDPQILADLPSYAPGSERTVPGHEVVCRVVAVGEGVLHYEENQRFIVQADYRPLKTAGSNGAFGYNFEGGLQQFVLMDERITGDPADESSFMIPVPSDRPASQLALVEPWACVENSYAVEERRELGPRVAICLCGGASPPDLTILKGREFRIGQISEMTFSEGTLDDLILVRATADDIEGAAPWLAKGGRMILLQLGRRLGRKVKIDVGRLHYMGQRYVGTWGTDLADALNRIPTNCEIGEKDRVLIVGAGGPMGQMHTIRALATTKGEVVATDTSDDRLEALEKKLTAWQGQYSTSLASQLANDEFFDVISLMAPVPALVQDAIARARKGAKVNVFAGIPVGTTAELDLDKVIDQAIYLFGTSGSEPKDMKVVLHKVLTDQVDTNLSVAAVSGMAGAIDGLQAVEERTLEGKIVVYPSLVNLPLIPLAEMDRWYPSVAAELVSGQWTGEAETELLRVAQ